jgi:hypothetical protein
MLADSLEQLRGVTALAHDLEPSPLKQARQALAEQNVIVSQHHA